MKKKSQNGSNITRRSFVAKSVIGAAGITAAPTILSAAGNSFKASGKIKLGVNMEYVRHHDKSFEWGVKKAAEIGYEYIEPMVHLGRELLSEARYFHSVSMFDDPLWIKEICDNNNIKLSLVPETLNEETEVEVIKLNEELELPWQVNKISG